MTLRQQPCHISVEHTAPHRRGGPHPTGGAGDKARNHDIIATSNKRQQPYHTISVEHTAPQGGAGPTKKTTGPTSQGGGKGRGQTRPGGGNTNPNSSLEGQEPFTLINLYAAAYLIMFCWLWVTTHPINIRVGVARQETNSMICCWLLMPIQI